jgi:pimeloyl-ACP methyl ester carboxylesterase
MIAVLALATGLVAGVAWGIGSLALRQISRQSAGAVRSARGMEGATFGASDGVKLKGWWWPGEDRTRAVLLLHGLAASRIQMFPRARWLHQRGYSVLLFDFRGCGESGGKSTLGYSERLDVEAALDWLRTKKEIRGTALVGQSMGAAAAVMAVDRWEGVRGAVLEHLYDRLESTLRSRIRSRSGSLEPFLSPLFLWQVRPRLGFSPEDLAPLDRIGRVRCPVLLGFGGRDETLDATKSQALFRAVPGECTFWMLPQAGHQDLYRFEQAWYQAKVGEFLGRTLGPPVLKDGER